MPPGVDCIDNSTPLFRVSVTQRKLIRVYVFRACKLQISSPVYLEIYSRVSTDLLGGANPGREILYSGISVPLHFIVASSEGGSMPHSLWALSKVPISKVVTIAPGSLAGLWEQWF